MHIISMTFTDIKFVDDQGNYLDVCGWLEDNGGKTPVHDEFGKMNVAPEGVSVEPDEFDLEDGLTAVDIAVRFLERRGCVNPSSSPFHRDTWYSNSGEDTDDGWSSETSCHLEGFSEEEQREVYRRITGH